MIYVVEVHEDGSAAAWFAFDDADFIRKVHGARDQAGLRVFECNSAGAALMAESTCEADSPTLTKLRVIAAERGMEAVVYRADYLLGAGEYQVDPIDEWEACVYALITPLCTCRIYPDDAAALLGLEQDPLYSGRGGYIAARALREQLIAMEVLADDM